LSVLVVVDDVDAVVSSTVVDDVEDDGSATSFSVFASVDM